MKTLQECKNEVARKNGFQKCTNDEMYNSLTGKYLSDEAAELYAKQFKEELKEMETLYKDLSGAFRLKCDENSRLLEEKAKLINTVTRRGIFFIENKETRRWVLAKYCADFEGDFQTRDPHKAQRFETILEALMTMKNEAFKMSDWEITEHIFCDPS